MENFAFVAPPIGFQIMIVVTGMERELPREPRKNLPDFGVDEWPRARGYATSTQDSGTEFTENKILEFSCVPPLKADSNVLTDLC